MQAKIILPFAKCPKHIAKTGTTTRRKAGIKTKRQKQVTFHISITPVITSLLQSIIRFSTGYL